MERQLLSGLEELAKKLKSMQDIETENPDFRYFFQIKFEIQKNFDELILTKGLSEEEIGQKINDFRKKAGFLFLKYGRSMSAKSKAELGRFSELKAKELENFLIEKSKKGLFKSIGQKVRLVLNK
ncbi:hypothetical protein BKN14_01780 [Candidatus Gracilibacteria bacterium HOT-871]|nr:hypothetical protein BKN14_01780 [Candidatus Gracilibacteria bacterium HOT-871]